MMYHSSGPYLATKYTTVACHATPNPAIGHSSPASRGCDVGIPGGPTTGAASVVVEGFLGRSSKGSRVCYEEKAT